MNNRRGRSSIWCCVCSCGQELEPLRYCMIKRQYRWNAGLVIKPGLGSQKGNRNPGLYCIAGNFRCCKILRNCILAPSEEIFVVLIFVPSPARDHTHANRSQVWAAHLRFRCSYFRGTQPIREKKENLHHAKSLLYGIWAYGIIFHPGIILTLIICLAQAK
jgi:hypothetical protein